MMWLKKGLLLLLTLGVLTGVLGCTIRFPRPTAPEVTAPTEDPMKVAYKKDPAGFVVFSRSLSPREIYVPISELLEYKSQLPYCNGTWFRGQLSGEDLVIYNSYLYALENRFIHFALYVEDSDKDFSYIREMISLDSPFLEQNYSHYEYIWKRPTNHIGDRISVSMEQFTDSRWEMKMEAFAKCRYIVWSMPKEYQTQQEKMEYLYDYVCDNVEYVDYESMADESYFYDAVCKGKTLCDGYSNMLSILFRMIGVECCEVMGYNEEDEAGHTWVVAKLNGEYYNFDPTFEDTDESDADQRKYFGFSDDLISCKNMDHDQLRPKCTETSRDFFYADMTVDTLTAWDDVRKITNFTEERLTSGENTTLIGVRSLVEEDMFDLFFDRFFIYSAKSKEISTSYSLMQNSALIEVTLTPR